MKPTMTYALAMAVFHDTATRRARRAGRRAWSRADYDAGVRAFYACFGTTAVRYHRDRLAGKPDPITDKEENP